MTNGKKKQKKNFMLWEKKRNEKSEIIHTCAN